VFPSKELIQAWHVKVLDLKARAKIVAEYKGSGFHADDPNCPQKRHNLPSIAEWLYFFSDERCDLHFVGKDAYAVLCCLEEVASRETPPTYGGNEQWGTWVAIRSRILPRCRKQLHTYGEIAHLHVWGSDWTDVAMAIKNCGVHALGKTLEG